MKLHAIHAGYFKLDGGAMHGVVPKKLWEKKNPPDENNLCTWDTRLLLVEYDEKRVLIDSGLGNKQSDKFFSYYEPHGPKLIESLEKAGFAPEDITDNFLTHLHFDHVGGAVKWKDDHTGYELTFPKATYWSHKRHWYHAMHPNAREKASFLEENLEPIQDARRLELLEEPDEVFPGFSFILVNGHTDSQMLPVIRFGSHTIIYVADLIPSAAHIPTAWVMGYDIRPLETMKEKANLLTEAAEKNFILFFEHDPKVECCTVEKTDKGIRIRETFSLADIEGK
ncbi:MAG: MBL fold metallo-hydrolase [Bacteroidia bacterium]